MKSFTLVDFNNGTKFCNCTYLSINDTQSHHLSRQVNNHHIGNENMVLLGDVKIGS
jgi:uncharacterized Zn-finger protein